MSNLVPVDQHRRKVDHPRDDVVGSVYFCCDACLKDVLQHMALHGLNTTPLFADAPPGDSSFNVSEGIVSRVISLTKSQNRAPDPTSACSKPICLMQALALLDGKLVVDSF